MVITFFVGSILSSARTQAGMSTDELGEAQAHYAAMGAINKAFLLLDQNPNWSGSWTFEPMPQIPDVLHSLESDRNYPGLGPNEVYLLAQGFTSSHGAGTPLAAVSGTAFRPSGGVQHAFFTVAELQLVNCIVDAYDASLGIGFVLEPEPVPTATPAPTTPTPTATPGDTPTHSVAAGRAKVGSNQLVELESSTIDGKVVIPSAGQVSNSGTSYGQGSGLNSINSSHLGTEKPKDAQDLPEILVPFPPGSATVVIDETNWDTLPLDSEGTSRILSPGVYRSVKVPDGASLAFQPGAYYFDEGFYAQASTDRITLKLTTENTLTKLFVGGEFALEKVDFRPVISVDPEAPDPDPDADPPAPVAEPQYLRVYAAGQERTDSDERVCEVSMRETSFAGMVVGEAVRGIFENSEIWGAVLGHTVVAEDVQFHYDTSLGSIQLAEHARWKLRGITELPPKPLTPTPTP